MSRPRLISFYLPQYYPTPENDEWWGKGFTEWTNVGRAKPLFKGHDQPRVPADLGYYDLRISEVRDQQAELAREAGIEGFCYWHYWFSGRRLLDRVFTEVVESGKPDFPFCLCWANHSWYAKTWDPNVPDKLLIEQTYSGIKDYEDHFNALLPAFKDKRYITINGKLLFGLFSPLNIPDFEVFKTVWNDLAIKNGLNGFYFFGFTFNRSDLDRIENIGYDATVLDVVKEKLDRMSFTKKVIRKLFKIPLVTEYDDYVKRVLEYVVPSHNNHPCINPNFDHSPRSAHKGVILHNSSPEKWGYLCRSMFEKCSYRKDEENIVFIKAWNEWGEGNYLEPDLKYGKQYLQMIKVALKDYE